MSKPNVLILGGVGFIGRNLVQYLIENDCADFIRVVDKVLPPTAFLGEEHDLYKKYGEDKLHFKQANLTNTSFIEKVFSEGGKKFNYVFNLAAETKFSQTDEVYSEKVFDLSVRCATEAAKHKVDLFVELSTAQVYAAGSKSSNEESKLNPWTNLAKYKLKAEEALKAIPDLPLIIVRPPIVYGPGDTSGLSPRIICGAVYKQLGEKMKFLWTGDLKINTVHVRDVCKALWFLTQKGSAGQVYNLADKGNTDQEKVNKILENIYHIKTGFQGTVVSNLAKLKLKDVTDEVNDKHLKPWADLCKQHNIANTPLTPYLDQELLSNHSLSIDGSKVEGLGFTYDHPQLTEALVRDQINYFVKLNLFPKVFE